VVSETERPPLWTRLKHCAFIESTYFTINRPEYVKLVVYQLSTNIMTLQSFYIQVRVQEVHKTVYNHFITTFKYCLQRKERQNCRDSSQWRHNQVIIRQLYLQDTHVASSALPTSTPQPAPPNGRFSNRLPLSISAGFDTWCTKTGLINFLYMFVYHNQHNAVRHNKRYTV
jgi:sRNA-binding regulator protein Hfq